MSAGPIGAGLQVAEMLADGIKALARSMGFEATELVLTPISTRPVDDMDAARAEALKRAEEPKP